MVGASVCSEGGMFPIRWVHQNLVIPRESIHETEHLVTGRGVDQQIYTGEGIAFFGASSVEGGVVDTKAPFTVVLTDQDHV